MFFSIIIPTYNRAKLIGDTIDSLLNQNFQNFELIIVDDGSTDDTEEVINKFNSEKISYYKIPNSERGYARNFGAKKAKGDYINFFDSDDIALSNHLEVAKKMIEKHNNLEVFHLNYAIKDPVNGALKEKKWNTLIANGLLWKGNVLSCNGVFVRKDIALKFPFNESRKLSVSEDWELWIRLSVRYKIHLAIEITSLIIDHNERSVMQYNEQKLLERTNELIKGLSNDPLISKSYSKQMKKIESHMLSYASLHAALCGHKKSAFLNLVNCLKLDPTELFTRRFLAICKHLLFPK